MSYNKYRAVKTELEGIVFDSKMESRRYAELRLLEQAGVISDLVLQPEFELIPAFVDNQGKKERRVIWTLDFMYHEDEWCVVEDTKSEQTRKARDYQLRRKLFKLKYPQYTYRETTA